MVNYYTAFFFSIPSLPIIFLPFVFRFLSFSPPSSSSALLLSFSLVSLSQPVSLFFLPFIFSRFLPSFLSFSFSFFFLFRVNYSTISHSLFLPRIFSLPPLLFFSLPSFFLFLPSFSTHFLFSQFLLPFFVPLPSFQPFSLLSSLLFSSFPPSFLPTSSLASSFFPFSVLSLPSGHSRFFLFCSSLHSLPPTLLSFTSSSLSLFS